MNPLTREWLDKGSADLATARRELRARLNPNYDAVCFHAQQSVEKALKAVLQEHDAHIPKTHQLMDLLALCAKVEGSFLMLQPDLMRLDDSATRVKPRASRRPGLRSRRLRWLLLLSGIDLARAKST
jgi:HEPN domain-containing protein